MLEPATGNAPGSGGWGLRSGQGGYLFVCGGSTMKYARPPSVQRCRSPQTNQTGPAGRCVSGSGTAVWRGRESGETDATTFVGAGLVPARAEPNHSCANGTTGGHKGRPYRSRFRLCSLGARCLWNGVRLGLHGCRNQAAIRSRRSALLRGQPATKQCFTAPFVRNRVE